jgi:hypothetical protein
MNAEMVKVANNLKIKFKSLPQLPEFKESQSISSLYVITRVREVIAYWAEEGLTPDGCIVTCSKELGGSLSLPLKIEGVLLTLSVDQYFESEAMGTFTLELTSNNPLATFIPNTIGIAYDEPITTTYHQSRWVLQEIDGNSPLYSHNMALLI